MASTSVYPDAFDTNLNLYAVADGLRVRLVEDYNPGDTVITVSGSEEMMRRFNNTGIITLTEQCSDVDKRALSFSYTARTLTTFEGLTLLSEFVEKDSIKPKHITNVTQNVMASHHNNLKDALIAIQEFAGKEGEVGTVPLEGTMEQRINYLRKIVLPPKAWFKVDQKVGLAPLTVTFSDQSFRLGTDGTSLEIKHIWDFGDNTSSVVSFISVASAVPSNISNVIVEDMDGGTITKTYTEPGIYTVTLKVINDFGEDSVTFNDLILAKFPAPNEACVNFIVRGDQILTEAGQPFPCCGSPAGGPFTTTPTIRSPINTIIEMYVPQEENLNTPGYSYAGEELDISGNPKDEIVQYTWVLSDDVPHANSPVTKAVYSVGGYYDLILRCDTEFGSYRITTYEDAFDIVEKINLWLWMYSNNNTQVSVSEFGLLSETFKSTLNPINLNVNDNFLIDTPSNVVPNETQQRREFHRNVGFAPRTSVASGVSDGKGILYWASGRSSAQTPLSEKILSQEFEGLSLTYSAGFTKGGVDPVRPWNWTSFASTKKIYFIMGGTFGPVAPFTSPTNQERDEINLNTLTGVSPAYTFGPTNYKNGANELQNNEVEYDVLGVSKQGNMSVYRSCWHGDAGFFLRNQGVSTYFRIKSFYKTSGNTVDPVLDIRKLPDMTGSARLEGQLVSMSAGVYFFSNSGAVAAYNPTTGVWGTGGPGINSTAFRSLQDSSVIGFDEAEQTLLAASDGDKVTYLSFDYSPKSFIRFSELDTTFYSVTARPTGDQWNMSIF
jgi:PKD repeat protein